MSKTRTALPVIGLGLLFLIGCTHGTRDSIHLAGHSDNFRCDDPAYAQVKKVQTFTLSFADGTRIELCRPASDAALTAGGACPDFRCEGASQYRDLVVEFDAARGEPSQALAMYRQARRAGNMTDAWSAILLVQRDAPRRADELWSDFWQTQVLPRYRDRPARAFEALSTAAHRGLATAMDRLSEVYAKGELGTPVDAELAERWKARAAAERSRVE